MKRSIVWQLLRRNISVGQLAGYAVANLLGLAIVLTAIQFYRDVTTVWESEDSFISRDYLIISKRVEGISLGGSDHEFSQAEVADIESQPWVRKLDASRRRSSTFRPALRSGDAACRRLCFSKPSPTNFSM